MRLLEFIAKIPSALHEFIVWALFCVAYPFTGRDRRLIQQNIDRVYQLPKHSQFSKTFVRQNLCSQALITLETIKYLYRSHEFHIEGMDEAREVLRNMGQKSSVVIITAHIGSWELAGHAAAHCLEKPFYVLAKPSRLEFLTPILNGIRERLGMKVLWTNSKSLLREMMAVSKRGEHLGFVMDQRPEHKQSGHPSVFLGIENTPIVSGPVMMATRGNLPVCSVYMMRTGRRSYRFYVNVILPAEHQITDGALVAQRMADDMSRMIMLFPEQWAWNYRRWKR